MKFSKPFLTLATGSTLLFAAVSFAQDVPPPSPQRADMTQPATPPAPADQMAPSQEQTMSSQTDSVTMPTPNGELTVKSSMPAPQPAGPAPSFEQLAGGGKSISEEQAAAYPLLANDFIYADHNRNHRISKSEYQHWLSQK